MEKQNLEKASVNWSTVQSEIPQIGRTAIEKAINHLNYINDMDRLKYIFTKRLIKILTYTKRH